jgi:hypothetical protein
MHGSRSKIPIKNLVRQRCAAGFNSGVKGLIIPIYVLPYNCYMIILGKLITDSEAKTFFRRLAAIKTVFSNNFKRSLTCDHRLPCS